jgi:SAM-dependent methyltransferase
MDGNFHDQAAIESAQLSAFSDSAKIARSFWERTFEFFNNRRTIRSLDRHLVPGAAILEIGVGSGSLLRTLKNKGFAVVGCDVSQGAQEALRRENIAVFPSLSQLRSAQFDIIIMSHVLEHVPNLCHFLSQVRLLLSMSGIVRIAVPNADCVEARSKHWNSYAPYHVWYFNYRSLFNSLNKSNFSCIKFWTHESFSGFFLLAIRLILGTRSSGGSALSSCGGNAGGLSILYHCYRLAMVCVGIITFPLRRIIGALRLGDELIVLAVPAGESTVSEAQKTLG